MTGFGDRPRENDDGVGVQPLSSINALIPDMTDPMSDGDDWSKLLGLSMNEKAFA